MPEKLAELGYGQRSVVLLREDEALAWWKATVDSLEARTTVAEAIAFYAELVLERWVETAKQQREGREVIALESLVDPRVALRDPSSFTIGEASADAAAEVLAESLNGLLTLPEDTIPRGAARSFYDEIEHAVAAYPGAATRLLYEARRERHGWAP
jgi:hypothetical protein